MQFDYILTVLCQARCVQACGMSGHCYDGREKHPGKPNLTDSTRSPIAVARITLIGLGVLIAGSQDLIPRPDSIPHSEPRAPLQAFGSYCHCIWQTEFMVPDMNLRHSMVYEEKGAGKLFVERVITPTPTQAVYRRCTTACLTKGEFIVSSGEMKDILASGGSTSSATRVFKEIENIAVHRQRPQTAHHTRGPCKQPIGTLRREMETFMRPMSAGGEMLQRRQAASKFARMRALTPVPY